MSEKNVSRIKISNNEEDIFLIKSIDHDKVNELYNEVFGDDSTDSLKKYIQALENKINDLEKRMKDIEDNSYSEKPDDDKKLSSDDI